MRTSIGKPLNILQLFFVQSEIVTQFMDDSQTDLFADFGLAGADCLNILPRQQNLWVVSGSGSRPSV